MSTGFERVKERRGLQLLQVTLTELLLLLVMGGRSESGEGLRGLSSFNLVRETECEDAEKKEGKE